MFLFAAWIQYFTYRPGPILSAMFGEDPEDVRHNLVKPADTPSQPLVFLSYSTRDAEYLEDIVADLETAGIPCWYSGRDISPGTNGYHDRIMDAINNAWLFVVLLSGNSLESPHVMNELEVATNRRKPMVPIMLEGFSRQQLGNASYYVQRFQMLKMPLRDGQLAAHVRTLANEAKVNL